MFRKNQQHLQKHMMSDLDLLSKRGRKNLENSWAYTFRHQFFNRLDERPFAVLYSDQPSRPNIPANVLVALEVLKSSFGWSDAELYENFTFNLLVRYAVGYENLSEGEFEIRTLYNFRQRLLEHTRQTGESLIEQAFEQVTDAQIEAFQIKTGSLRTDSTQVASNIRRMGRLQLVVEMLQRVYRMLSKADQQRYAPIFEPYLKGTSGQYVYRLKGEEPQAHMLAIGQLIHHLLQELAENYGRKESYQLLQRVFDEQYRLTEPSDEAEPPDRPISPSDPGLPPDPEPDVASGEAPTALVQVIPGKEVSPQRLRSPDDPDATYRKKAGQAYEGYVVNLTETCAEDNPFQLVVKVQTAPNSTEDTQFLLEALDGLVKRTGVKVLYTDGGYCSPDVDDALRPHQIDQVPTALRGKPPDPNRTNLSKMRMEFDEQGKLQALICPHEVRYPVQTRINDENEKRYIARPKEQTCEACDFTREAHHFNQVELDRALRRQRSEAYHQMEGNPRSAVEATVGAVKRPFSDDKLPVRRQMRMHMMMVGAAVGLNIRRIWRHEIDKKRKERQAANQKDNQKAGKEPADSFLSLFKSAFGRWLRSVSSFSPACAVIF